MSNNYQNPSTYQGTSQGAQSYQQPYRQMPQQNGYMPQHTHKRAPQMSLGQWILTLIVLGIPLVGFIMLLVWGFGGQDQPSRRTYCQAVLIIGLVVFLIGLLISLLFSSLLATLFGQAGWESIMLFRF